MSTDTGNSQPTPRGPTALLRNAFKRGLRGVVIKRHLPAGFGRTAIYVSPESQLKYLKPGAGGFDTRLLRWAKDLVRQGDMAWDIGANVGVFAFAAAARGARVLAVEPDPFLSNLLLRSGALPGNRALDVTVLSCAISREASIARLVISAAGRAANSLAHHAALRGEFGVKAAEILVPAVTLDSLLAAAPAPDIVKIDVEGAELDVIAGAEQLLQTVRPKWIFECGSERWDEAAAIFRRHGYRLYDADGDNTAEIREPAFNTLAIPQ